jgi:hypothetical protein
MRRTLSLLSEYRKERLKKSNAAPKRLAEVDELYRHFDMLLSGVTLNEVGGFDGPESALGEVMTTADFTNAMGDFVQRQMWPAYTQKRFEFEQFVKPDTTPNYQNVTRKQNRAGVDDLEWVGDKGTARPGSVDDSVNRQYKVEVWQKQFDFSMRTLVNDDLGYLQDQATDMGRAARRTLEKFVSRFLLHDQRPADVGSGEYGADGLQPTPRCSQRTDQRHAALHRASQRTGRHRARHPRQPTGAGTGDERGQRRGG